MKPSQILLLTLVAIGTAFLPAQAADDAAPPPPIEKPDKPKPEKPEKPEKPGKEDRQGAVKDLVDDLRSRVDEYNRQKNELVNQYKDASKERRVLIREQLKELQAQFKEEQKEYIESIRKDKLGDLGRVIDDKVRPPAREDKDKSRE